MVLDYVVVLVRVCWLCVVPRHCCERWQGLVVMVDVYTVRVMVWCGPVWRVGWVAGAGRLRWRVVVTELVGATVVLWHQGVGVGGGRGVLMVLVDYAPWPCMSGGPCVAWS